MVNEPRLVADLRSVDREHVVQLVHIVPSAKLVEEPVRSARKE